MARELIGFLLVSLVFLVAFRIWRSVGAKRAAQEALLPAPAESVGGIELGELLYVATVFSSRPLDRIWAYGLGVRGKAKLFVSPEGISIERRGERDLYIPMNSLRGITTERATIDKGVEKDGLIALHWTLGSDDVTTHLRVTTNQKEFMKQLEQMTGERFE